MLMLPPLLLLLLLLLPLPLPLLRLMACAIVLAGPDATDADFVTAPPFSRAPATSSSSSSTSVDVLAASARPLAAPRREAVGGGRAPRNADDDADFADSPSWVPAMPLGPASTPPTIPTGAAATDPAATDRALAWRDSAEACAAITSGLFGSQLAAQLLCDALATHFAKCPGEVVLSGTQTRCGPPVRRGIRPCCVSLVSDLGPLLPEDPRFAGAGRPPKPGATSSGLYSLGSEVCTATPSPQASCSVRPG